MSQKTRRVVVTSWDLVWFWSTCVVVLIDVAVHHWTLALLQAVIAALLARIMWGD